MYNSKKMIDIVMPNYNKGEFIGRSIESVIKQSYKNWRLLIVDDNSSDESRNVILRYKKNKKIKFFFLKKNMGPSFCRNLAIKNSKSNFIAFLDSDDYWMKNKLKLQIAYMIKNRFSFTFSDYIPIFHDKNLKKKIKKTNIQNNFTFDKFINNSSINTSTMILERKHLHKVKFRNLKLMEDYIFKCELMKKSNRPFVKYPKVTAIYRIIKKSRSSKKILNLFNLWKLNRKYNKLGFFRNLISLFLISFNSIKKYGLK